MPNHPKRASLQLGGEFIHDGETGGDNAQSEEIVQFCVADVRKRLNDHLYIPKKMFKRDPEDPSGKNEFH